ncbi:hypothetical protein V6N13_042195 [Hibiscus sabdariffa]
MTRPRRFAASLPECRDMEPTDNRSLPCFRPGNGIDMSWFLRTPFVVSLFGFNLWLVFENGKAGRPLGARIPPVDNQTYYQMLKVWSFEFEICGFVRRIRITILMERRMDVVVSLCLSLLAFGFLNLFYDAACIISLGTRKTPRIGPLLIFCSLPSYVCF